VKTNPTRGTKIDGKRDVAMCFLLKKYLPENKV
jgi:hypothetical protein